MLSFVKRHSARDDSQCMDVQTRWLWMLYGCRNQEHMLLWLQPEDVVQILHRMYSFLFYIVSRQQPNYCQWLSGESCKNVTNWTLCSPQRGTNESWHKSLRCSVLIMSLGKPPTFLCGVKRDSSITAVLLFTSIMSKPSLYIFLWGNEPLTFSSKW